MNIYNDYDVNTDRVVIDACSIAVSCLEEIGDEFEAK